MVGNNGSKSNKKKSSTVNSFKTKNSSNTKHNEKRGYNKSSSVSARRPLPELPKRENNRSYGNYGTGYTSSEGRYRSPFSYYGMENSRKTETGGERKQISGRNSISNRYTSNYRADIYQENYRSSEQANKASRKSSTKKSLGAAGALGIVIGSVSQIVKGSKRSNSRIVNNKTISAKRNSVALPIFIFFIFMCFIYIIGSSVNFLTKKIVSYDVLSYGTIDTPKSANAVIVRSEKVYNTDKAGVISYDVADNEKVKKGTVVCSIKDEAVVAQMQASLDDINEQIMKIQSERKDISVYSEDIKKYNAQMKEEIDESALDYAYMKLGNIYELENTIQKYLDTRNQYLLTENSGVLSDLVSQKKEQESKLNENISNLTADESGIVCYYIDGLEEELTPENMASVTKNTISDTVRAESSFKSSVKANSPAFKLVTSNIWYIVSYIKNDYIDGWEKGDTRSIYIKDNEGKEHKLEAYIEEMTSNSGSDEKFVIFKLTRDITDFINVRNITIETESSERGFKIPNDAIVEETLMKIPSAFVDSDGNVTKLENGSPKKVSVNISGKDPDDANYCYTPVQMGVINVGDTIKAADSEETFVIADVLNTKGIYVVNTGIAEFKTINLTNSVSNSTHTILDPSYNTNIYVYDRIMTDPRNVEKQEMVYE
ncbi:MAG: HlyD family efflux transporter periplasmic adaptor subunit [Clostridia bacterium]|nr:HlyD family efflux transporter periplasmic adaptor subunit [Clostridia bacterium]